MGNYYDIATLLGNAQARQQLAAHGCAQDTQQLTAAAGSFYSHFGRMPKALFSSPGRTELCGNHTDHQCGRVIAAAISSAISAAVAPRADGKCIIYSDPLGKIGVELGSLAPIDAEKGTSAALVRGVAEYFKAHSLQIGGFDAAMLSGVPIGSGLSSSAAFEVLIALIFSELYNGGAVEPLLLAQASQYAENAHFGKPCGLMDQAACALGGAHIIDFSDPAAPKTDALDWTFGASFALYIVNTGSSHADMADAYAQITADMLSIAAELGCKHLGHADENEFMRRISALRSAAGDRAVMRALHFFAENRRVEQMAVAIKAGNSLAYAQAMQQSAYSSETLLQNIFTPTQKDRSLALGIALAREYLRPFGGVARVHGGGFAGTLQALLPAATPQAESGFVNCMEALFGPGSVMRISIRPTGAVKLIELGQAE